MNLKNISQLVEGELKGDPGFEIASINSLYKANENEITFSVKDDIKIETLKAGALIVGKNSRIVYPNLIYVQEPYLAFARLLEHFFPHRRFNAGIDENAYVAPGAVLCENVSLGAFAYVGENSQIGENTEIHTGVKIYRNVKIGKNCLIYANVVIREDVEIGDHVIIQPGAVIGADGFGFTRLQNGTPIKVPQKGKVIIGSHCEIGANTCIDRSTIEETVLDDYVKTDNLVQVGHNVKIGQFTAISALSGISGSANIGQNVIMGGQVGIADHISIPDGVMIAAKTGVSGSIKEKCIVAGYPHMDIRQWRRSIAVFRNLESFADRIKYLETKIKEIEKQKETEEK